MRPELFSIPLPFHQTLPVYAYGFMVMLGFVVGIGLAARRARTLGTNPAHLVDLGLWSMVWGILGARTLYVIQFRSEFDWSIFAFFGQGMVVWPTLLLGVGGGFLAWWRLGGTSHSIGSKGLRIGATSAVLALIGHVVANLDRVDFGLVRIDRGGLVFYGGLVAATAAGIFLIQRKGLRLGNVADCVAPSLALGLAFGRIGCYLNGCCWGRICHGPLAVTFPASYAGSRIIPNPVFSSHLAKGLVDADAPRSLPVHPTQLYSSLAAFTIFLLLTWWFGRRKRRGELFAMFAALYGVARFTLESFRADNAPIFMGMTLSQSISVVIFAAGIVLLIWLRSGRSPAFVGVQGEPAKSP